MNYRIKEKQKSSLNKLFFGNYSENFKQSIFYVQCKYKYFPVWITITTAFDTEQQAKNHIKLKQEVYNG